MRRSNESVATEYPWFYSDPVRVSKARLDLVDDSRIFHCGGKEWVVGVFPSFIANPANGRMVNVLGYDTAKFFKATKYVHPKQDGLLDYGRAFFVAGTSREARDYAWRYVEALESNPDVEIRDVDYSAVHDY